MHKWKAEHCKRKGDGKMNDQLEQIRLQINETDEQLSRLLSRRMDLVAQVAKIKETAGLPIYDPQREKRVLEQVSQSVGAEKSPYLRRVYQSLMNASKDYERALMETVTAGNRFPFPAKGGLPGRSRRLLWGGRPAYVSGRRSDFCPQLGGRL